MIGYLVPTLLLVLGIAIVVFIERQISKQDERFDWRTGFGPLGFEALILTLILMWIVPGGILLLGPIMLLASVLSPAGRVAWVQHKRPRILVSVCLAVMFTLGGFTPVSTPESPSEWGQPLFTENPNAPFYPAGEQYTWLMLPEGFGNADLEIIQSLSLRLPYQYGSFGAESSAFWLASLFNMEQGRLNQAVELLDQEVSAFRIDVDEIKLEPMAIEGTHRYVSTEEAVDQIVSVRLYELRSLSIGVDEDGMKVGEVLCIGTSNWGGELDVLVIVRPIGHSGLSNDRYSETLVIDWLST
ncbi:MAG TPA: hypothetical protein QF401_07470 [Candidatus Poseidoniaceae archaeon]|nr:hypothetical protein [Candidatus Poseidoniaceae archaeon]